MGALVDIGEVRAKTGLPASTLHYYERNGLIRSAGREGLRRQYAPDVVDRLATVILCQRAGFSIGEIRDVLDTGGEPTWKELAQAKLAHVRRQIDALREIERGLEHALECPSENLLRCGHFRAELAAAIPVTSKDRPRRNTLAG